MNEIKKAGFVGLGLIGGSVARAIRGRCPGLYLSAFDTDKSTIELALSDGTIDEGRCEPDPEALFSGCDVIFICTPVLRVEPYLPGLKAVLSDDTILTDVGSVKGEIFSLVEKYGLTRNFIGGHPMAGTEKSGYANSFASMLDGANYVLTPSEDVSEDKLLRLRSLIEGLGCRVLILEHKRHDLAAAAISHLPHILAYSLSNLISDTDDEDGALRLMAAGGLKDMTRIASSSPDMWEQICLANSENIILLLDKYTAALKEVRKELLQGDGKALNARFARAKAYRDTYK